MNLWHKSPDALLPQPIDNIFQWMTKPYVLSQALKRYCQQLTVTVISEKVQDLTSIDLPLPFKDKTFWVRQVLLKGDNVPWTYGRVIAPEKTYQQYHKELTTLGTQLLGETLLYSNAVVTRDHFEYAMINSTHCIFQTICQNLPANLVPNHFYGRRSLFYIQDHPLLVSEFFLPTLPLYSQ